MTIQVYLPIKEMELFSKEANRLGATEGELAQALIRIYLKNPDDTTIQVLKGIVWLMNDLKVVRQPESAFSRVNVERALSAEKFIVAAKR